MTPGNIQRRAACAGTWWRLGEARENLGRVAEAVEVYRICLAHQRALCTLAPDDAAHRRALDDRLRHASWLLLALGRSGEAAELTRERGAFRPGDPAVPLSVAVQHGAAILLLLRHHDGNPLAMLGPEVRRHAMDAPAAANDAARRRSVAARGER